MSKISFFFKRLFRMDLRRFSKSFLQIKQASKKNSIWLLFDMLRCGIVYNAGYMDYKIANMYNLNKEQRASTITRGISNSIVQRMNPKEDWHYFDNKAEFNTLFSKYIKRDWLELNSDTSIDEFKKFIAGKDKFIYKPLYGSSGVGIKVFHAESWLQNIEDFFFKLQSLGQAIIEEMVVQHDSLMKLNPSSVNTIRVATLLGEKKQGIVYAFIRIGNGKEVDNVDCGGMAARVDLTSGKLLTVGADKSGNTFKTHPGTNTDIIGFTIPFWEDIKSMCLEASKIVPSMRFIAWDVAVTNKGPLLIEGNSFPSHAVPQFAAHYPDGIGILKEFREFIEI